MTSLASLLDQRLIDEGDELSFVFRTHRFFCTVLPGGHLGFCTWKKSQHANAVPVLRDRGGFKSLTDWCDAALQEVLDEWVTRFSAYKRVRHVPSGIPMSTLRDVSRNGKLPTKPTYEQLERTIDMLRSQNQALHEAINKLTPSYRDVKRCRRESCATAARNQQAV